MCRVNVLAKQYAETESKHRKRLIGMPLTDYERDLVVETYKRAYSDAIRHIETMAIYSEKGILERIREMKR